VGLADLSVKYKEEANHVSHVPRNEKNKFSNNVRSKYADQCKKNVIQLANPGKAYSITAQESRQGEGKLHTHAIIPPYRTPRYAGQGVR